MNPNPSFDTQNALQLLAANSGLPKEEIIQKMNEKIQKYSGLLTEQGALVLLSKELNVKIPLFEKPKTQLKLGELKPGMSNIDVKTRVKIMDKVKPFSKNGKEGKYLSIRLQDETGEALFTFWNEQAEEAIRKGLRVGSTLVMQNARVGNFGQMVQLSLGYNGNYAIENENNPTNNTENTVLMQTTISKKRFAELNENEIVQTRAHIIDVLPGKGFFVKCNACGSKLQYADTICMNCGKEGNVETRLLVSLLLDDGTKPLRAVAFENEAMQLYEKNKEEILSAFENEESKRALNETILGKIADITGKSKMGMDKTSVEIILQRVSVIPFENA